MSETSSEKLQVTVQAQTRRGAEFRAEEMFGHRRFILRRAEEKHNFWINWIEFTFEEK